MEGFVLVIFVFLAIAWTVALTWLGVKLAKDNNYWCLLALFLALNVLGLIIGICILGNNKRD